MTETLAGTCNPGKRSSGTQYVYFYGDGKAEGNTEMRDLLGGKGAGPGGDDERRCSRCHPASRSPPTSVAPTRRTTANSRTGFDAQQASALERLEALMGKDARLEDRSAARLRAFGGAVLHARHDGHGPQPGPERQVGHRAGEQDQEPALRLGLLPPLHPDVRLGRHGAREARVRRSHRSAQEEAARPRRHRPARRGSRSPRDRLQEARPQAQGTLVPAGSARTARARA